LFILIAALRNHQPGLLARLDSSQLYFLSVWLPFGIVLLALALRAIIRSHGGDPHAFGATLTTRDLLLALVGLAGDLVQGEAHVADAQIHPFTRDLKVLLVLQELLLRRRALAEAAGQGEQAEGDQHEGADRQHRDVDGLHRGDDQRDGREGGERG